MSSTLYDVYSLQAMIDFSGKLFNCHPFFYLHGYKLVFSVFILGMVWHSTAWHYFVSVNGYCARLTISTVLAQYRIAQ